MATYYALAHGCLEFELLSVAEQREASVADSH